MKNLLLQCMEIVDVKKINIFSIWCFCTIWLLVTHMPPANVYDVDCNKSLHSDLREQSNALKHKE